MTPEQAISSIREDIDRLEAKNVVKPGHIHRRRNELQAIEDEIARLDMLCAEQMHRIERDAKRMERKELRLGMLANVLAILGFDPFVHLSRPLGQNPEIYRQAAQFVHDLRREAGKLNRSLHYTHEQQKDLLANALWAARLNVLITPTEKLNATEALQPHGQEREAA